MKTNLQNVALGMLLTTASMSGVAYANCPVELAAEEKISCLRIEGAGVLYQDYLNERAESLADAITARTALEKQDIAVNRKQMASPDDVEDSNVSSSLRR